jgi:hypothetical protein
VVTEAGDEAYSVNLIGGFRCIMGYLVPVLSTRTPYYTADCFAWVAANGIGLMEYRRS